MARNTGNRVTVAGTVTPELFDFIDEQHWKLRKTRSEVVGDVLLDWAKSEGFVPTETGEEPVEDADAELADAKPEESGPQAVEPGADDAEKQPARARAKRAS